MVPSTFHQSSHHHAAVLALAAGRCCCSPLPRPDRGLNSSWTGRTCNLRIIHGPPSRFRTSLRVHASIEELSHNQVLLAALTASLLGQIVKPFTAALQGKGFNWKLVITSGGMPSSHSASVAAACTALALERGLADSLFGMAVVFAGIVMYDAQGVRRAVGKQAEVINMLVLGPVPNSSSTGNNPNGQSSSLLDGKLANGPSEIVVDSLNDSDSSSLRSRLMALAVTYGEEENSTMNKAAGRPSASLQGNSQFISLEDKTGVGQDRADELFGKGKKLPSIEDGQVNLQEVGSLDGWRHIPLKESVGHSTVEVIVGGLWGVLSTLALSQFIVKIGPG